VQYFPLYLNLENKKCLIFGGGKVAARKIKVLEETKVKIILISIDFCDGLAKNNKITKINKRFEKEDIIKNNPFVVIAATNDKKINNEIYLECNKKNILINVVDSKEKSSFIFPSILTRDELVIAISTQGDLPSFSYKVKKEIDNILPTYYGKIVKIIKEYRKIVKFRIKDEKIKKKIMNEIIEIVLKSYKDNKVKGCNIFIEELIKKYEK
jgi:siroheme synthase-like protein